MYTFDLVLPELRVDVAVDAPARHGSVAELEVLSLHAVVVHGAHGPDRGGVEFVIGECQFHFCIR